ncbi:MAG TPA: Fic family protein [Archangium sp.]|uniref:Fic family protein n=1 Tax=Archangium sp. TaxID=1872627 RepID=UPI002E32C9CA|nr:Fic family protein [Archangium sp.]HEX5754158.1 Fic family protein [Archangium sp.]
MPELTQLDRLLEEGRKVEGWTALIESSPACQLCQKEGRSSPAVVDGRLRDSGQWANMCRAHLAERGEGIGPTAGRVLIPTGPANHIEPPQGTAPIGYAWLISEFALAVLAPHRLSFLGTTNVRREIHDESQTRIVFPPGYAPGPRTMDQLEFALKHEGLNLEVLATFFRRVDREAFEAELVDAIRSQPLGQYRRRIWFLYEWLTDRRLPVSDLSKGNYIFLLDPEAYYTGVPQRFRRQRIDENLLGDRNFSPIVRRTEKLAEFERKDIRARVASIVEQYDPDALHRAAGYLYTKETRSSFAIEGERPSANKEERFVALLQGVPKLSALSKEKLVQLQGATVDPRYARGDYRDDQVYVAMPLGLTRQRIEYIAPKPGDVPGLMSGLLHCMERMARSMCDPVVDAAVASFGFVFIHPFPDGNGRLHRLLIHYILSRRGVTPGDFIFPVSAVMESRRMEYDKCLESFSRPLMKLLDYTEGEDGKVTVQGDSAPLYRYFDATRMAEDLYHWVFETVDTELQQELDFIARFREARKAMAEVVDLREQDANLFVSLCRQNGGRLSKSKRETRFSMLTDGEIAGLEKVVRTYLMPTGKVSGAKQASASEEVDPEAGQPRSSKHTFVSRTRG